MKSISFYQTSTKPELCSSLLKLQNIKKITHIYLRKERTPQRLQSLTYHESLRGSVGFQAFTFALDRSKVLEHLKLDLWTSDGRLN